MPKTRSRQSASFTPRVQKLQSSISTSFSLALRYVHLQLLPQTTRWKQDHEETKVATYYDRRVSLLGFLLHALPFAGVLALIILNVQPHYVGEVNSTKTTAIQFAAKLLEILIQSSLAAMLLDFIRTQALGESSLPLGRFLAPYRMTDISYLWSLDFWGSITSNVTRSWQGIVSIVVVVASFLMAALVGPASAVAMIPRLTNFPAPHFLLLCQEAISAYPSTMELILGQVRNSNDIQQSLYTISNSDSSPIKIVDTAGSRSMITMVGASEEWSDASSIAATIPTQAVALLLRLIDSGAWNMAQTHALQPWAKQSCTTTYRFLGDGLGPFVSFGNAYPRLNGLIAYSDLVPTTGSGYTRNNLPFVTLADSTKNTTLSWFSLDGIASNHSLLMILAEWNLDYGPSHWKIHACVIDAIWNDTPLKYTGAGGQVAAHLSAVDQFPETGTAIVIQPEWADALVRLYRDVNPHFELEVLASDAVKILALGIADAGDIEDLLSSYIGFGRDPSDDTGPNYANLTTTQYDSVVRFINDEKLRHQYDWIQVGVFDNWTDASTLVQYPIKFYTSGYGYDSSTIPVQLSLTVLCIYLLAVTGYTIHSLITGRTATSWDSIGEIVMLALNSRQPEHIKGSSVGVGTLATYRKPVNIRIHSKKNEAEVIFGDDPGLQKNEYKLVEPNERY